MIHFCTCSGRSASALEQRSKQEATDSCKNCGGKPLVDGRGTLSGSMLSTVGIELNRVIDSDLNWRTVPKSNKRGARRARASFTAGNKKKHVAGSLKGSEDLIDKDLKGVEDMPVSESEKLGVTILGRRFSDSVESIPLKKRKVMFRSPSPPPRTQSPCPEEFEHLHKIQSASNRRVTMLTSNVEQQFNRFSRGYKRGLDAMDSAVEIDDENKCLEETKPGDNADFSGISILAAAACNSNIELGVSNADEGSDRILQKIESSSMLEESCQKHLPDNAGILDCKTNVSAEILAGRTISLIANNGQKNPELSQSLNETAAVMGSFLAEKSPDSSQNLEINENGTLVRHPSSSRDDRSHWDLNTVMDAWEAPHGDPVIEAEPHEDSMHERKAIVIDHCEIQAELIDTEHATEMTLQHEVAGAALNNVQEDVSGCANSKLQEKPDIACDGSATVIVPGKNGETCSLVHEIHEEAGEEQQLDASVGSNRITCSQEKMLSCESNNVPSRMLDVAEDSKHNEEQMRANGEIVISAPVEPLQELEGDCASLNANSVIEGTADLHSRSFDSATKGETASSHLFAGGDDSSDHDVHACESHSGAAHITSNAASEDRETNVAVVVGNHSGDQCKSVAQESDVVHPRSPQIGKDSCQIDGGSAISVSASPMSAMLVDKNASDTITTYSMGSQVVPADPFGDATCNTMDQSKNEADSCHSDSHILESVDCEEQPAANACVSQDVLVAETMACDVRVSLVADSRKDATESDLHSAHNLATETQGTVETQLDTGDLLHLEAQRSNEGDHARISGKVALEDSFDGDYDSDGSQNDHDNVIAMETVSELQGDDDSQYEDGEFRESFVHSWEDAGDEGDAERVDYGSDNVDTDAFEMAADYAPSASLQVQNAECKKENSPEPDCVSQEGDLLVDKKEQETNHVPAPSKLFVCTGSGKKRTLKVVRKAARGELMKKGGDKVLEMNVEVAANPAAEKAGVDDESGTKGDGAQESSHSILSRIKSTGWDRLPEVCRSSREAANDVGDQSTVRNPPGARFDSSDAGESLRRAGSTSNRQLSSRIGGLKSSDVSFRKDKTYVQGSRPHDLDDSNPRGERDGGPSRSLGRGVSSGHMRGRGRGSENWLDSSGGHWSRNRHHSPGGHYSGSDISPPGPRNAAAAAAAKLESSGYVLDANGTIVKSGAVVPAGRVHRRSANASSQSTHRSLIGRCSPSDRDGALRFGLPVGHGPIREMSPGRSISAGRGRSGRNGPRVFATGRRDRYSGPIPDDDIDSSFHVQHPIARRERSFSPIPRRTFHISRSRTKSRSRSRTRSPHMWTSPRGRSGGINGGTGFRRHSRSPNFRSEARMERLRSPDRRPRFAAHMVDFVSASGSHGSPPHASRWADDRKDAPDYFREHEYKRSSGSERSPPGRAFPRGHRFDFMGSPGRLKPEEYRPVHSGRLAEFVGVGRGTRHEGSDDDRRKHGERYGMIHSIRHYDIDGDVKRFRYDVEDGFRSHNSRTKNAPEFHGRGGSPPRDYGRDIDGRLGAPRRVREERGHFRCDRDGKQNASFKAFGMRECDEDGTLRRRRPS